MLDRQLRTIGSLIDLGRDIDQLRANRDSLQRAVDAAYGALCASQYIGGPTEREAWQAAIRTLSAVVTQHKGQSHTTPIHRSITDVQGQDGTA